MSLQLKPRKVISINYSYIITLPREFTDFHKIVPHDMVDIYLGDDEEGRFLMIKPISKEKHLNI